MKNKKFAYSLAEVMVVMLILTIIFAAFAPIVTRRKLANSRSMFNPWSFTDTSVTMNAFYSPTDATLKNAVYFGLNPGTKTNAQNSINKPDSNNYSKVIIRANDIDGKYQSHLQFRYGRGWNPDTSDYGNFAANLLVDTNKNILFLSSPINEKTSTRSANEKLNIDENFTNNIVVGGNTLSYGLAKGEKSVIIGYSALAPIQETKGDVAIGSNAGATEYYSVSPDMKNVYVGAFAGEKVSEEPIPGEDLFAAWNNLFIGYKAGHSTNNLRWLSGNNTYIGSNTGSGMRIAEKNTAIGYNALSSNTTGRFNVAIGSGALKNNTSGTNNIALGYNACENVTTGSNKICIGAYSGPRPTLAGTNQGGYTNVPFYNAAAGSLNTAIANQSAVYDSDSKIFNFRDGTTDSHNRIYIGKRPQAPAAWGNADIGDAVMEIHNIGRGFNPGATNVGYNLINFPSRNLTGSTTVINGNLIVNGHAFFTIGDNLYAFSHRSISGRDYLATNATCPGTYCPSLSYMSFSSDRRLKHILGKNTEGLDKINQIKVYNYTFKADKEKTPQVGVIAQELQKIFPNSVTTDEKGYLKIRWDEMFFASLNAIKQLDVKVAKITKKLFNIENQIAKLEKENSILKSQVDSLEMRITNLKKQ